MGNSISEDAAFAIISNLLEAKLVTAREAKLMRAAVGRNALALPINAKDVLRAAVLNSMLIQAFRNIEGENDDDV